MMSAERKHRLTTRWTHWVNFPVLFVMVWSGLLIYWSNGIYRVGLGKATLFHFFPEGFYKIFHIDHRLAEGMALHFLFMWFFALNGVAYVVYSIVSGEWREMAPDRNSLRDSILVTLHDLGLRKQLPPQTKYNAAQKIAYTGVIVMGFGSLLTGLAIYRPIQVHWLTSLLGGYEMARWEHFWLTMGYVAFFIIHVAQVVRAGWGNFRSMVMGYEMVPTKQEAHGD